MLSEISFSQLLIGSVLEMFSDNIIFTVIEWVILEMFVVRDISFTVVQWVSQCLTCQKFISFLQLFSVSVLEMFVVRHIVQGMGIGNVYHNIRCHFAVVESMSRSVSETFVVRGMNFTVVKWISFLQMFVTRDTIFTVVK